MRWKFRNETISVHLGRPWAGHCFYKVDDFASGVGVKTGDIFPSAGKITDGGPHPYRFHFGAAFS